jgi:hypothetical protein
VVEIGKAQEALKLSKCGWGWLVIDDLAIGWIHPCVRHVDKKCSPGNGPCPCIRIIFLSWCIACVAARCVEPTEYSVSFLPKTCCK